MIDCKCMKKLIRILPMNFKILLVVIQQEFSQRLHNYKEFFF